MPSWLPRETLPSNSAFWALRQTVREEFDGYRGHIAVEMQEDILAHVEARIAEVRDFFREQFNEGACRVEQHAREHSEMFAAALREEVYRELISVERSGDRWTQCGFLRVSMKSLLWLWSLREIVAENVKEECETVFCATSIKVPMVPYLNESSDVCPSARVQFWQLEQRGLLQILLSAQKYIQRPPT